MLTALPRRPQWRMTAAAYRGGACLRCHSSTRPKTAEIKMPTTAPFEYSHIYERWEQAGLFAPLNDLSRQPFTMLLPPPNVTGSLHIGHALTVSIQDTIVRWKRMCGYDVQWIPGTDHAGIATQTVVEKHLSKLKLPGRHELGREKFLAQIFNWKKTYGNRILDQLRQMGVSVDWKAEFFTLDEERSKAVNRAFLILFERGLIYRGSHIVSWCPALETVLSDIEVEQIKVMGRTLLRLPGEQRPAVVGQMYTIRYPFVKAVDENDALLVATTRPETMFGDVAVAVHPDDPKLAQYIGKFVINPVNGAHLPVVGDSILVRPDLGTGAVKITPAHDADDFACGIRHGLEMKVVIDKKGKLTDVCGKFSGLTRFHARDTVLSELSNSGHLVSTKDHETTLFQCSRTGDLIEPMVTPQWHLKCERLEAAVLKSIHSGAVAMEASAVNSLTRFFEGRSWCLSRQLWWGHRIPAYRYTTALPQMTIKLLMEKSKFIIPSDCGSGGIWVVAESKAAAQVHLECLGLQDENNWSGLVQDDDVLDTWFSSALLPLSAQGWPSAPVDARRYPLSIMETGSDILFFWVARMLMLCLELEPDRPPFSSVLLHGMVRDGRGRKMSKSLGNVIDPLDVIKGISQQKMIDSLHFGNLSSSEVSTATKNIQTQFPNGIPQAGVDALRLGLLASAGVGSGSGAVYKFPVMRFITNKLWNSTSMLLMRWYEFEQPDIEHHNIEPVDLFDQWILHELRTVIGKTNTALKENEFASYISTLESFIRHAFCDVYIEHTKIRSQAGDRNALAIVLHVLHQIIRCLHPAAPFVTEELWSILKRSCAPSVCRQEFVMQSSWPTVEGVALPMTWKFEHGDVIAAFREVLVQGRDLRNTYGIPFTQPATFAVVLPPSTDSNRFHELIPQAVRALKARSILMVKELPEKHLASFGDLACVGIPMTEMPTNGNLLKIEQKLTAKREKLEKESDQQHAVDMLTKQITHLRMMLMPMSK